MKTAEIIRHSTIQAKRVEKILDAEHQKIQLEKSLEEKNWLFYKSEEKQKCENEYKEKIEKLSSTIEEMQKKYVDDFFIKL